MQSRNVKLAYPAIFFPADRLDTILIRHRFSISSVFPCPHVKTKTAFFKKFHSGERFQKVAFSVAVFIGYVWTEAVSVTKKWRFQMKTDNLKTDTCGRGLKCTNIWAGKNRCKLAFFTCSGR